MSSRAVAIASAIALSTACIDAPRFAVTGDEGAGREREPAWPPEAEMVYVPATPIDDGALTPSAKNDARGDQDGKGKGKGKGSEGGEGGDDTSTWPDAGGSSSPATPPASPLPRVVPAFWIDAREVAVGEYAQCVASGGCREPVLLRGCTAAAPTYPIACVTLSDARAYCAWRGKRLVTSDEFTAAAAGATRRPYPWGDARPAADRLNACGAECSAGGMYAGSDGYGGTAPSGSFSAGRTPEGAFDLAGNVAEWVDAGSAGIVRGGSFEDVDIAAVASRAMRALDPEAASPTIGFRCAQSG